MSVKEQIQRVIDVAKDSKTFLPMIKIQFEGTATGWIGISVSDLRTLSRLLSQDKDLEREKVRKRTADWRARNPQQAKQLQWKHDELAKQRRLQKKQNGGI